MIQRGEGTRDIVGVRVGRRYRGDQPDPVGHHRQRPEKGERLETHHEDGRRIGAGIHGVGKEDEIELSALGRANGVRDRLKVLLVRLGAGHPPSGDMAADAVR